MIGPEFEVSSAANVAAGGDQTTPAVTATGSGYFVVWRDERIGRIFGSRVNDQGPATEPIPISSGGSGAHAPAVSWDGENIIVVWIERSNGQDRVVARRLDPKGTFLDESPIVVRSQEDEAYYDVSVAWGGENFLVVWQVITGGWDEAYEPHPDDIRGARVSKTGRVLDTQPIDVAVAARGQMSPSVATSGNGYFVVWQDTRKPGRTEEIVYDDDSFLGWGYSEHPDIFAARVSSSGTVLDPDGIELETSDASQFAPDVAFDGEDYWVLWEDARNSQNLGRDLYGIRVSPGGLVSPGGAVLVSGAPQDQLAPRLAPTDGGFFALWQDLRDCESSTLNPSCAKLFGTRISAEGHPESPDGLRLSDLGARQSFPAIGSRGASTLVVWEEASNVLSDLSPIDGALTTDVFGIRMNSRGEALSKSAFAIATDKNTIQSPSVAFDGTNYFVVWQDSRASKTSSLDIYGGRITPDGELLDGSGIAICTHPASQSSPTVAWNGSEYLVAWTDERNDDPSDLFAIARSDIYGARVSADGKVLDPEHLAISRAKDTQVLPAVASAGKDFFVVWTDYRGENAPVVDISGDLYGARVGRDGRVFDADGLVVTDAPNDQSAPQIVSANGEYFVVWVDRRPGTTTADIYGKRLSATGLGLGDDLPIGTANFQQTEPAVTTNGSAYFVVWMDSRSVGSSEASPIDLYGARVDKSGQLLDPKGLAIFKTDGAELAPKVTWDGQNFVVAWEQAAHPGEASYLVRAVRVSAAGKTLDPSPWKAAEAVKTPRALALVPGNDGQVFAAFNSLVGDATRVHGRLLSPELDAPADTEDLRLGGGGCACRVSPARKGRGSLLVVLGSLSALALRRRGSARTREAAASAA